jgi:hypothetical protein
MAQERPGDPSPVEEEAISESAWLASGDLNLLAVEVGMRRLHNEPPPEWLHKALLGLAVAAVDTKPYARLMCETLAAAVGMCRLRNEPPQEWLHKALLNFVSESEKATPYMKKVRSLARSLVRYVAVREAHDREGLPWEAAAERASEMLRGQPARASSNQMWAEYKRVRGLMRTAGTVRDAVDPGYSWIDGPPKPLG